jgi:serine protease Do
MRLAWLALVALLISPMAPAVAPAAEPPLACAKDIAKIVAPLLPATVAVSTLHITQGKDGPKRETFDGSGFIIDPAGLIVTNNHVADGAAEITVTLHDNTVLPATVVGQDDLTDLAVIKVRAETPLPAVKWGNSDDLQVGQSVIVIGNPYGMGISVSTGIVSGLDRDMREGPYDDYIQTDAAINHGNSGGPMFDLQGRVVGINSVVFSPSANGGSVGIGFAIPSNVAKFVVSELIRQGYVRRGWLGARIQDMTPAMADAVGLPHPEGAIIVAPVPGGPAANAGLQSGDVVLRFGDRPMHDFRGLSRAVATQEVGTSVPLTIWRDGSERTLSVTIAVRPGQPEHVTPPRAVESVVAPPDLGLALAPLNSAARVRYHLDQEQTGLLVTSVTPGSTAAEQDLRAGDVILRVQDVPAVSADIIQQEAVRQRSENRDHLLVLVQNSKGTRWVALRLA